jgi:hypothetical protein
VGIPRHLSWIIETGKGFGLDESAHSRAGQPVEARLGCRGGCATQTTHTNCTQNLGCANENQQWASTRTLADVPATRPQIFGGGHEEIHCNLHSSLSKTEANRCIWKPSVGIASTFAMSQLVDPGCSEQIKNIIRHLYVVKGYQLQGPNGVMKLMEDRHGFKAT